MSFWLMAHIVCNDERALGNVQDWNAIQQSVRRGCSTQGPGEAHHLLSSEAGWICADGSETASPKIVLDVPVGKAIQSAPPGSVRSCYAALKAS